MLKKSQARVVRASRRPRPFDVSEINNCDTWAKGLFGNGEFFLFLCFSCEIELNPIKLSRDSCEILALQTRRKTSPTHFYRYGPAQQRFPSTNPRRQSTRSHTAAAPASTRSPAREATTRGSDVALRRRSTGKEHRRLTRGAASPLRNKAPARRTPATSSSTSWW